MRRAVWLGIGAALALGGAALAEGGRLTVRPATTSGGRLAVVAGLTSSYLIEGPALSDGATGQATVTRGGREVWQLPLRREGGGWSLAAGLPEAGAHVLAVRLYDGARVLSAAVDLGALDTGRRLTGEVAEPLEFSATTGRGGGDASGWWGAGAMVALFTVVWLGSQGWRRRAA